VTRRPFTDAGRCDGIVRARPATTARRGRGFTLIEVLLATVLLAAGLALAFATLTAASQTARRGEALARHSERVRAVEGFLRQRLTGARPIGFAADPDTLLPLRFVGDATRMRFVADLPDYLGHGGPYLHDFRIVEDGDETRIELDLSMVLAGQAIEESPSRPPEVLVDELASARFRYRGAEADGGLGEWQEQWLAVEQLPLMVEVTITGADGREWPPLIVALPLAGGGAGVLW
jgi:general secretion pathway protein J